MGKLDDWLHGWVKEEGNTEDAPQTDLGTSVKGDAFEGKDVVQV